MSENKSSDKKQSLQIRLIGCGKMGSAMAIPLSQQGYDLSFYDHDKSKADALADRLGGVSVSSLNHDISQNHIILLAIKPQDLQHASTSLSSILSSSHLLISVLTGVSLANYRSIFPQVPVLRMMPNLAIQYGKGFVALVENSQLTLNHREKIEKMFACFGLLHWITEDKINLFTSLIGSGPAFIFSIVEAITEAGIAMGLPAESSYLFVQNMIQGALAMLSADPRGPSALKWDVTSPSGTTIEGLRTFESKGVRSGIIETFLSAYQRAIELSNTISEK